MALKLNWTKTFIASGLFVATLVAVYFAFKKDFEEEEEDESYKQLYNSSAVSTSRVDKMSKKDCVNLLQMISDSQELTKQLMFKLVEDLLSGKLDWKIVEVYQRALPEIPVDPLESKGLTLFDLDYLVDKYQNDPSIRDVILNIMNVVPPEKDEENVELEEIVRIHEFMLSELEKLVSVYKKLSQTETMDKKALTLAVQALISARVQQKFGYNYTVIDRAVIKNHSELSMNTKFARLTMQIQSEMSEITGMYK